MAVTTRQKTSTLPGQGGLAVRVREDFGITRRVFARMTGFSERALADWESGKRLSEPGLRKLKEMERLRQGLTQVLPPEAMAGWLEAPSPAFGGLKPLEVLERGEIDRIWSFIFGREAQE